jgi:titin
VYGALVIDGGNSIVRGLDITHFGGHGIVIQSNGGDTIEGNYIGVDSSGSTAAGNSGSGIAINNVPGNTIIGNVLSGNGGNGLGFSGPGATGNVVEGNYIGTDATGNFAIANTYQGIDIYDSSNNTIGGTTDKARNVISGNVGNGILIEQASTGNTVEGNYIGTDVTGTVALGNTYNGVLIGTGASNNTIGGTMGGARNVISGNGQIGIYGGEFSSTAAARRAT